MTIHKSSFDIAGVIRQLKSSHGAEFFQAITLKLSQLIDADYTFIALLDRIEHTSTSICLVSKGKVLDNFSYALGETPCEDVSNNNICIFETGVAALFPNDLLLEQMGIQGYLGTPLCDSKNKVMGLLVALYQQPIADAAAVADLFELFSGRIAAEIERTAKEQQLIELNHTLEEKVRQRTAELAKTVEQLQTTQQQIFEKEKQAALGRLVSGVAHEVNTPLGSAVLASSSLTDQLHDLQQMFQNNSLTRSQLQSGFDQLQQLTNVLNHNLERTADLIDSFKQVAMQQYADDKSPFSLAEWFDTLKKALQPQLTAANATLVVAPAIPHNLQVETYQARLTIIFSHIINNCCSHAFSDNFSGAREIRVGITTQNSDLRIDIADTGIGMPEQVRQQACDPFFTTKRNQGAIGLGLCIVNNLVVSGLQGKLELASETGVGTRLRIVLPQIVLD